MSESAADDGTRSHQQVPFISRVRLKNYKSIAECDVRLGPLTLLVGPNGSGKSNFLDALAFLARALETTPAQALEERGGLGEILRRVPEQAKSFSIAIDATARWGEPLEQRLDASYGFEIGAPERRGVRPFEVVQEGCTLWWARETSNFNVERGRVRDSVRVANDPVTVEADRLYLPVASAQAFRAPLFNRLRNMQFYNFDLDSLRRPQLLRASSLSPKGAHLGRVLEALKNDAQGRGYKRRIDAYLHAIVPEITGIEPYLAGNYMTVVLRAQHEVEFGPEAASDGTMRAAGVLAAIFQPGVLTGLIPLVGIEEPEIALHPAAGGVLFDALTEASERVQVVATSQSADLLDREDLDVSTVRAVTMKNGLTTIGEVDEASRRIVREKLYTIGELMRANQLSPQPSPEDSTAPRAS